MKVWLRRLWLLRGPGWILPILLIVALGIGLLLVTLGMPAGPVEEVSGRVDQFTISSNSRHVRAIAIVSVDGDLVRVRLPVTSECNHGDTIALERHARLIGGRVYQASSASPCSALP